MGVLSPRVHGFIDYAAVAMLAMAPWLFDFGGTAQALCYFLAATHLGLSLLTAYPLGAAKVIPFPVHGGIEAGIAVAMVAIPFLFGFHDVPAARNFFIGSGIALGGVWAVTNYHAAELPTGVRTRVRI